MVLRFGLYRVCRLRRSKESNSRPNQVKLGNSLIVVVNLELGNVLPLRDSWVWFGLEQGNVLPLSDSWVDLVWNKVTSLPLGYSWVFVWFRYHFSRELVLSIVNLDPGNVLPLSESWSWIFLTRPHLRFGYNCTITTDWQTYDLDGCGGYRDVLGDEMRAMSDVPFAGEIKTNAKDQTQIRARQIRTFESSYTR